MALTALGSEARGRIVRCFQDLDAPLPTEQTLDALVRFLDLVLLWNTKVDLTAARNPDELLDLFLADAIVLSKKAGAAGGESWVDVGSGAGAPAIALALLAPGLRMTLVEPKAKRVAFLRSAIGSLERADIRVERARVEDLPSGAYDVALSRAVLDPRSWLEHGTRVSLRHVWVLLARAEPPAAPGWAVDEDVGYHWPLTGAARRAVRLTRTE